MKKVLVSVIFLIVFIACVLSYLHLNSSLIESKYSQRQNITFLKFVSSENCMYSLDTSELNELKSLNVNGIRICVPYSLDANGNLVPVTSYYTIVNWIRKAHNEGLVVFLDINAGGKPTETGEPEFRYHNLDDLNKLYNVSLFWAEIAEREKVEFYSPLNEPNIMFTNSSLVNLWINKSKLLKSVFMGDLVLKFADTGLEDIVNISGYDYLAYDIMWSDNDYERLSSYLDTAVEKGNNLKSKYNLKGFFFGELGTDRTRVNKDVQTEIFRTILNKTWGKVDGYCFIGWTYLEFGFRDNPDAKEVIREWFNK